MGCSGCSSGRGCSTTSKSLPGGCRNNGSCGTGGCNKLGVFDWLSNMEMPGVALCDVLEVRFKNGRKEFYRNVNNLLTVVVGDVIAVEASPGHDIGVVSAAGEIIRLQLKKKGIAASAPEIKKVYRKARQNDIDKWREAQGLEEKTMHRARNIAVGLGLQMKISDVEFQGDKTKAIFYYTADERVDFRELIKKYAEEFKVRIEMRQIGARQEASRLGGIGSCGRELCCSTWLTDFRSVSTSAARYQQLSLNPLKLAGQCGKLKCCLNYELDSYLDAIKDFPDVSDVKLKTKKGDAVHQKTDIFRRTMWFSYFDNMGQFIPLPVDRVKEIIEMNKMSELPVDLGEAVSKEKKVLLREPDYENVVGQDSLTRFDNSRKKSKKPNRGPNKGPSNRNSNRNRNRPPRQNRPSPEKKP
jgi:cell fate regulator YaaT (PSP1 superfamily)